MSLKDKFAKARRVTRAAEVAKEESRELTEEEILAVHRFDACFQVLSEHLDFEPEDNELAIKWKQDPDLSVCALTWMEQIIELDRLHDRVGNRQRELAGLSIPVAVIPAVDDRKKGSARVAPKDDLEPKAEPDAEPAAAPRRLRPGP